MPVTSSTFIILFVYYITRRKNNIRTRDSKIRFNFLSHIVFFFFLLLLKENRESLFNNYKLNERIIILMPPNIKKIINEISILVKLFFNTYYYIEINLSINLYSRLERYRNKNLHFMERFLNSRSNPTKFFSTISPRSQQTSTDSFIHFSTFT